MVARNRNRAEFWAKGGLGFFDLYVILLAKKLKDSGVLGVSSDEYLQYAMKNRAEWSEKADQIVAEMLPKLIQSDCISKFNQSSCILK